MIPMIVDLAKKAVRLLATHNLRMTKELPEISEAA